MRYYAPPRWPVTATAAALTTHPVAGGDPAMAKLTLPDQQAWIDWCRVEDCLRFGITRWGGFMLAALLADKYVKPISDWLAILVSMTAFGLQVAWMRREDARRTAGEPGS